MSYNVLTDFHHASLLQSFILLFEKRLGGQVFRPIGMEWAEKGFWKVYDHPATQQQYLELGGATPDGTAPLNQLIKETIEEGLQGYDPDLQTWVYVYKCYDIDSGFTNRAVTYKGFLQLPIDIVIASLPQHLEPFRKLCDLHPNNPKLIYQIGNAWPVDADVTRYTKNVMASAIIPNVPEGINFIQYHQEFDLEVFRPSLPHLLALPIISSFVNVFQSFPDYPLFEQVERQLPSWQFYSYGGQCRDGAAHGSQDLASKMRQSRFIWHTKLAGDGYGHVLHNSAAVGRPLIVKKEYYQGKMGEALMIDGKTCIAIDGLSVAEIVNKIEHYNEPERYAVMCRNVYENFKKEVDFDREAKQLVHFLENLL